MIKRTLGAIAEMCGGRLANSRFAGVEISGVTKDSRNVSQGQLYVPIIGEKFDGHDFAAGALENGAAAVLWQENRPLPAELADRPAVIVDDALTALQRLAASYRRQLPVRIVGITGSNGKTTTKDLTAAALSGYFRVFKTEGNLNSQVGLPIVVLQLEESTEVAVLEMGMSEFGEIERLTKIARPDIAIITNIGEAHMQQLGSRAGIAQAKLEIVSGIAPGGLLLYNGDEPLLRTGVERLQQDATFEAQTFGLSETNDWKAENIIISADTSAFDATGEATLRSLAVPVPGRHNVSNALAAAAAAKRLGVPDDIIRSGFAGVRLTGMRIEPVQAYNGAMLLNDAYNANPTAVRAAIDLVAQLDGYRRKWLVLGDMLELGPEEAQLHGEIGSYIDPGKADGLLTYGALSRHTAAASASNFGLAVAGIADEAAPEERGEPAVIAFDGKNNLIEWLRERLAPEDLVLVKGSRGMRMEEIVHALMRA